MSVLPKHVKALLDAVYGARWGEAYLEWGTFPGEHQFVTTGKGRAADVVPPDDRAVFWLAGLLRAGTGRANANVEMVKVIVADDVGTAAKSKIDPGFLGLVMPEPTVRVESSPGNWQWQWCMSDGMDVATYEVFRRGLPFTSDATAPSNLIRLPMGVSGKPGVVHAVKGELSLGLIYPASDLIQKCGGLRGAPAAVVKGVEALKAPGPEYVTAALKALPNDGVSPYCKDYKDGWITFGMALYGATGGEGEGLWLDWNLPQNQTRDLSYVWASFHDTGIGWVKLRWLAMEYGKDVFEAELAKLAAPAFDDDLPPPPPGGGGLPNARQLKYAKAIAERHGAGMRYVLDRKAWARFDGAVWKHLPSGVKLAGQYAMEMALRAPPRDRGEHDVTTAGFMDGVEGLCRQIPALQARETDFDCDPWLLGTPDGTVDLRTGALREAAAGDMISKSTAVGPGGACPRWKRFLAEVTKGDLESIAYLQQYAGYCLTGLTIEEVFLFLYGPGGNGKSKFVDTLSWLWGDYAVKPVADLFLKKAHGMGHTSKLAMLAGARLATASEVPANAQWDEAFLKDVTGGGAITAGFKHKDEFTFVPAFKLLAYGNSQPTFPGGIDKAIKRRFRMMEFLFEPKVPDTGLFSALKKEGPGILQWAIEGCLAWQKTSLMTPKKVEDATDALFEGQDLIAQWLEARVEKSRGGFIGATDLFNDWLDFRNAQGERELLNNVTAFGLEMTRRGLMKGRTNAGKGYQDVILKSKAKTAFDDE